MASYNALYTRFTTLNPQVIVEKSCKTLIDKALQLRYFHLIWCYLQNTAMKILNSQHLSSFGGINFVLEELNRLDISNIFDSTLPKLPKQSKYSWKDLILSYWSVIFCGGDCAEDISINLRQGLKNNPFIKLPSPDRLLDRLKHLSEPSVEIKKNRSTVLNEFSYNNKLNSLNIQLLKKLQLLKSKEDVLDYDNTFVYTKKADAKRTYTKDFGYCPGVGIIGNNIVYVENRNGNCAPHTLQEETLERMFQLLKKHKTKVKSFRADAASYQFSTITKVNEYVDKFYIRAKVDERVSEAISKIEDWSEFTINQETFSRGSTVFTPFKNTAKKFKKEHLLKEYKLVVTKQLRRDGQMNLFTGEACNYSPILTSDFKKSDDEVVIFYNQRGKQEREFDILKNDFIWDKLPFSKLEQNTVFFIITAMCRNLFTYIIEKFSNLCKNLKPHYRLKKFIFRFICIPAKWVINGRQKKLRLYGHLDGFT